MFSLSIASIALAGVIAARAAYDSCRADAPGDDRFEDDLVGDPGFPPPPPELMLGI